jgi:hypothetical protein
MPEEARMRVIVIATVALILLSALVYAAFDMRRDHNQVNKIRDECRRAHSDAGEVKQCIADMALRRAKEPELP